MTQALDIISGALRSIGALESGEAPEPTAANDAFTLLNDMLDQWSNDSMLIFNITEIIHTLVNGTFTYTLGIGGAVNAVRPLGINNAYVRVSTLDYQIKIVSQEDYALIGLKTLAGPWPTVLYYNPGVPLGLLTYWPVPGSGDVHLFADTIFTRFATINGTVNMPQGYNMALRWNLAELLLPEYGKSNAQQVTLIRDYANKGRAFVKSTNMKPQSEMRVDWRIPSSRHQDASWVFHGGFLPNG